MKPVMTAAALLAASIVLAACAKKEEAAAEPEATPPAMEVTPAPVDEAVPPDENSEDAEQSGGDKVKPN